MVVHSKGDPADEADKGAYRLGRPTALAVCIFRCQDNKSPYSEDKSVLIGPHKIIYGQLSGHFFIDSTR